MPRRKQQDAPESPPRRFGSVCVGDARPIEQVLARNLYVGPDRVAALLARIAERGCSVASSTSVKRLGDGEFEVFCLIGRGKANRDIAQILHRSIKTMETCCSRIKDKLGIRTGAELIQYAFRYLSSDQERRLPADATPSDSHESTLANLVTRPTAAS